MNICFYRYDEANCGYLKMTYIAVGLQSQYDFNNNTKVLPIVFTLISHECTRSLPETTWCMVLQWPDYQNRD